MTIDCSKDVVAYHNDDVTLPQAERTQMRDRRDANRKRILDGLEDNNDPEPIEFCKQGSYAMKTMVQHPDSQYDIDDGIYFEKEDLVGRNGGYKSALDARYMVRDAVDDGCFITAPEVCQNCIRVYYEAGYHVDIPVYRRVVAKDFFGNEQEYFELASSDWKRSDARNVTEWFNKENHSKSPDKENGRQLRRIVRYIKDFAQSRSSWDGKTNGFMITVLVVECYQPNLGRDDIALHDTMAAIRNRMKFNLVVNHPVTPNDTITKGADDLKARFLRDRLDDAITWLKVLSESSCTREKALSAWDKVFNTEYFSNRYDGEDAVTEASAGPPVLSSGIIRSWSSEGPRPVQKEGGGRYA
jgi:hypothetical protein